MELNHCSEVLLWKFYSYNLLHHLCTLQPIYPLTSNIEGLKARPLCDLRRLLSNRIFYFFLLTAVQTQQPCLVCSPLSSTIGNAACARSKPHNVFKSFPKSTTNTAARVGYMRMEDEDDCQLTYGGRYLLIIWYSSVAFALALPYLIYNSFHCIA